MSLLRAFPGLWQANREVTEDNVPIRKLYVDNFEETTTESDLRTVFEEYGTVEEVVIVKKPDSKVFAFVTFADVKSTKTAGEASITLKSSSLMVNPAYSWHQPDLEQVTMQSADESEINYAESLLLLNDDCLLKIFSLLELKDLVTMGKTCWRLKNVAEMIFKTKKEFDLSDPKHDLTMMNIRNILEAIGPFLRHFKANCPKYDMNDLLLTTVAKYCKNLTALSLMNFKITCEIKNVHVLLKNLKKLHLSGCRISERDLSILIKGSDGNQLEEIDFSFSFNIKGSCLSDFKNLKVANLSVCYRIGPEFLVSFIGQNTTLEDLNVDSCGWVNLQCITAISSKLRSLKKLHLSIKSRDANPNNYLPLADLPCLVHLQINFTDFFPHKPFLLKLSEKNQLEYLDISNGMFGFSSTESFDVLGNMTKLKVLKLNFKSTLDNKHMKIIIKLKDLEILEIAGGSGITKEGLLDVVKNCKHIRRMNISNCYNITNNFILDLMDIVEGRPQILTLLVYGTQIKQSVYTDNLLKPSKFIKLDFGPNFYADRRTFLYPR